MSETQAIDVAIMMGSKSDLETMQPAASATQTATPGRARGTPAGIAPAAAPASHGTRSPSMRMSTDCVSGSPKRQFHSITIGPRSGVSMKPP